MPRAKKQDAEPAGEVPASASDVDESAGTEGEAEPAGSEEVMVVLPAADEPVRCGGHVLTDDGWVLKGALVTEEAELEAADDPAPDPDPEQE